MRESREICRQLGINPTAEQMAAMLELERRGQRMLIDFGYENALEKMRAIRLQEAVNIALRARDKGAGKKPKASKPETTVKAETIRHGRRIVLEGDV